MSRLRVWRNRVFVGSLAPIISFASRFAGNILLSRLLIPEEFGAAIAISTVVGLGGLVTDMALDRFVMIEGSKKALSTAHMLAAVISVSLALALIVAAPFAARLFGVADFVGSFAVAAGLSALSGFAHLGIKQIQRDYDYGAESVAQVTANLAGIAGLYLGAVSLHDHRAIVIGLATQIVVYVTLTHVLAQTSYSMDCNKVVLRNALSFGLPLMLNGVGLAIMYQLDRVLVGSSLGVKELATYAVVFSMSVVPTNLILSVFSSPSLSYLLSAPPSTSDRSERYRLLLGFYSILSTIYACWMVLALDVATRLVFGPKFFVSSLAHVLFTVIACLRLQRGGAPTLLFLASGRTGQLALMNLVSGLGLAVAFVGIAIWPRLESMLIGIAIGELISFTLFFTLLERAMTRKSSAVADFASAVAAPVLLSAVLAWNPNIAWESRGLLLGLGIIALSCQTAFELHRNRKFRDLLFNQSAWNNRLRRGNAF